MLLQVREVLRGEVLPLLEARVAFRLARLLLALSGPSLSQIILRQLLASQRPMKSPRGMNSTVRIKVRNRKHQPAAQAQDKVEVLRTTTLQKIALEWRRESRQLGEMASRLSFIIPIKHKVAERRK